jgi:hypothetical protein
MTNAPNVATRGNVTQVLNYNGQPGWTMTRVEFAFAGRRVVAIRFKRPDLGSRGIEIYYRGADGMEEFVRYAHEASTKLSARAIREMALAEADIPSSVAERFAQLELV